jgi:hypothetical protein
MTDKDGHRRLDGPEDYVRVDIETARTPATRAPLVRRNAVEINTETFDTRRLISTVQKDVFPTLERLSAEDQDRFAGGFETALKIVGVGP